MITGAIKNKIDKIWTDMWAGGITNPLAVIEQPTYIMFIRHLDEKNWLMTKRKKMNLSPDFWTAKGIE